MADAGPTEHGIAGEHPEVLGEWNELFTRVYLTLEIVDSGTTVGNIVEGAVLCLDVEIGLPNDQQEPQLGPD